MRPLERKDEPQNIPAALADSGGKYRWSWDDRRVYEIQNWEAYHRRLDAYWDFVERFYTGATLTHAIDRLRGFNLYELDNGRIIVAAFETIHGNDCYSFQGCIREGAIARCALAIRDAKKQYRLRIAAWHHSIHGPPCRNDYMDIATVHEMIGNGFRLGLHGHQHSADVAAHYIHVPDAQSMAVVAAGSLCAGSRELPRGVDRQYNVVRISDDYASAKAYVREMSAGFQFGRSHRGQMALDGAIGLAWTQPADAVGNPIDFQSREARRRVLAAEAALQTGDSALTLSLLNGMPSPPGSFERALLVEAARRGGRWELLVDVLDRPETADELVLLVEALTTLRRLTLASSTLETHSARLGLAAHIARALTDRIDVAQMLGGSQS